MTGLLEHAGIRPAEAAPFLADLLRRSHRPVTLLFRDTFGIPLHPVPLRRGDRDLDRRDPPALDAPPGTPCQWRAARLETPAGQLAASAYLLWLPGRLPAWACEALDAGQEAAGAILNRLPGGMHRGDTRAVAADRLDEITGVTRSVISRAVLVTAAGPAGYAEENWAAGFVESLAG